MYRSGFIALLGRPNVGKSTLLNRLIGQKIAIASPVPQTTRHRIKGVLSLDKGQIVFLDTPGFSKPLDSLGHYLTDEGRAALTEADAFVLVVDASQPPGKGDEWVAAQIRETGKPTILALNKIDVLKNKPQRLLEIRERYHALIAGFPEARTVSLSAKTGRNLAVLKDMVLRCLPEGPRYYPEDAVTDQRIREITAEIIREKVLLNTREEIPHSVAVGIERFDESDAALSRIDATLYVDQKSQKGIVIGQGGQMIKTIGASARQEIETLLGGRVHLALNVKVRVNWRKDVVFLKSLGLAPPG